MEDLEKQVYQVGREIFLNQNPPLPPKRKISPQEEQKEQWFTAEFHAQ